MGEHVRNQRVSGGMQKEKCKKKGLPRGVKRIY